MLAFKMIIIPGTYRVLDISVPGTCIIQVYIFVVKNFMCSKLFFVLPS